MVRSHLLSVAGCGHDVCMGKHHSHQRHGINGDGAAAGELEREPGRLSRAARLSIVAESFADGAVIADVARRHGIRPQRLFAWRSAARTKLRSERPVHADARPLFVPALVGDNGVGIDDGGKEAVPAAGALPSAASPDDASSEDFGTIEIALGGAVIRVRGAIDVAALCAVLKALKAAS